MGNDAPQMGCRCGEARGCFSNPSHRGLEWSPCLREEPACPDPQSRQDSVGEPSIPKPKARPGARVAPPVASINVESDIG